jgi:hypothetical protein
MKCTTQIGLYYDDTHTAPEQMDMKVNVGMVDKVVRIIAGLVLIGLTLTGTIGVWGWIGVIPLVTGVMGWCPLYSIIGVNTCGANK